MKTLELMKTLAKKTTPALTLSVVLPLIAISQLISTGHAREINAPSDGFIAIKVAPGLATADHLIDTVRPFLLNHPESLEGRPTVQMSFHKKANSFVVNIIKRGYLDDSVSGEHLRGYVVRTSTGRWELISMRVKYICYRGKSANGKCL